MKIFWKGRGGVWTQSELEVTLFLGPLQDFLKYSSKAGLDCDQIEVSKCDRTMNPARWR